MSSYLKNIEPVSDRFKNLKQLRYLYTSWHTNIAECEKKTGL